MRKVFLLIALAVFGLAANATAAIVFDLSPTNNTTFRSAGDGPGQGVEVGTTITITDMAFFLDMPSGGDLKFMIWDDDNSDLLFSTVLSGVAASETQDWVYSDPFSFTLQAGQTYWFGIMATSAVHVGYIFPPFDYSANGLTAITTGNSNYLDFNTPYFDGYGGAAIGLRLVGGGESVPEPGTIALMGAAFLLLAGALRRKLV